MVNYYKIVIDYCIPKLHASIRLAACNYLSWKLPELQKLGPEFWMVSLVLLHLQKEHFILIFLSTALVTCL